MSVIHFDNYPSAIAHVAGSAPARGRPLDQAPLSLLTPREQAIFAALADGCTNREIAARLRIKSGTVKTHLRHIFQKLNVHNRTLAVLLAVGARPSPPAIARGTQPAPLSVVQSPQSRALETSLRAEQPHARRYALRAVPSQMRGSA